MNLRDQIKEIAARRINSKFAESVHFAATLRYLAEEAFREEWPECLDTKAIRKALKLLATIGHVSVAEPPVQFPWKLGTVLYAKNRDGNDPYNFGQKIRIVAYHRDTAIFQQDKPTALIGTDYTFVVDKVDNFDSLDNLNGWPISCVKEWFEEQE